MVGADEYHKMTEAKLKEIRANIDALRARAENMEAQAKIKFLKEIESLREHENAAEEKLREMKSASEEAMEKMKSQLDDMMNKLKGGYGAIVSIFK